MFSTRVTVSDYCFWDHCGRRDARIKYKSKITLYVIEGWEETRLKVGGLETLLWFEKLKGFDLQQIVTKTGKKK